jgi:predicted Zn finger-like uncharacterized protein
MRLVCPNCDAEYEVDDAAIPRDGRDVQCSNCGHAWFQAHPEVEAAAEAEADLYDPPEGAVAEAVEEPVTVVEVPVEPVPEPEPEPVVEVPVEDDDDAVPEAAPVEAPPRAPRSLDETVLAVLREEAEREVASRRAEAAPVPVIESQTEMPLAAPVQDAGGMVAAVRRIARLRGLAAEVEPADDAEPAAAPKSRGQMFPAIEEINSTLRATGDRGQDEDDAIADTLPDLTRRRGGFRRGFVMLIVLAVIIVALYLLAPVIAARVPALAGAAAAYVAAVDAARVWLDANLRALVTALRGLADGQGG